MGSNKFTYVGGYFKLHELATSWIYRNYLLSYTESGTNILNIFSLNILTNRPRRQFCPAVGGSQSAARIYGNTPIWLAAGESGTRSTSRSLSRYI